MTGGDDDDGDDNGGVCAGLCVTQMASSAAGIPARPLPEALCSALLTYAPSSTRSLTGER